MQSDMIILKLKIPLILQIWKKLNFKPIFLKVQTYVSVLANTLWCALIKKLNIMLAKW